MRLISPFGGEFNSPNRVDLQRLVMQGYGEDGEKKREWRGRRKKETTWSVKYHITFYDTLYILNQKRALGRDTESALAHYESAVLMKTNADILSYRASS